MSGSREAPGNPLSPSRLRDSTTSTRQFRKRKLCSVDGRPCPAGQHRVEQRNPSVVRFKGKKMDNHSKATSRANGLAKDPSFQIWVLLNQARDALGWVREKELNRVGLSRIQARVLYAINASTAPVTPAELSRRVLRKPHTMSALLARMEKEGLIRKANNLPRKNLIRIEATERGQELFLAGAQYKGIQEIMSSIPKARRESLKSCLKALRDTALEKLT